MKTKQFKTNINCGSCVKAVSPHLNKIETLKEWKVDTEKPEKTLTVASDSDVTEEVMKAVKKAGFEIEVL